MKKSRSTIEELRGTCRVLLRSSFLWTWWWCRAYEPFCRRHQRGLLIGFEGDLTGRKNSWFCLLYPTITINTFGVWTELHAKLWKRNRNEKDTQQIIKASVGALEVCVAVSGKWFETAQYLAHTKHVVTYYYADLIVSPWQLPTFVGISYDL